MSSPSTIPHGTPGDAAAPDAPILVIDFGPHELFPRATVEPLFRGTGDVLVYDAGWSVLRPFRIGFWKSRMHELRRTFMALVRAGFNRRAGTAEFGVRHDLGIPDTRRVIHAGPTLGAFVRTLFRTMLSRESWRGVADIREGRFSHLRFEGIPIGGYLVDSFLRRRAAVFFFFGPRLPALAWGMYWLSEYLTHAEAVATLARRRRIGTLLVNHLVYAESGMLAHVASSALGGRVPVFHSMLSPGTLVEVGRFGVCPYAERTRAFLDADARTDDVPQPMWQGLPAVQASGSIQEKRCIILAMHCLLDANDVHDDGTTTHPSFLEWIRHSIEVLRSAPDVQCFLRLHPLRHWYGGLEETMYRRLFRNLPPNCRVLPPEDPQGHPTREDAVVVTFRGSIALELACLGRRAVAVGEPNCPAECYAPIRSREAYEDFLRGGFRLHDDRLPDGAIALADRYRQAMKRALDY